MKYCKNCNTQLNDDELFCPNCGTKYEETMEVSSSDKSQEPQEAKTSNTKKKIILFSVIALLIIAIASLGYFVIYPQVTQYMQQQKNEDAAQKVMELIDSAASDEITLDSEKALEHAKAEYNSLTDDQKALVKNYDKLDKAYTTLDQLKIEQENQEKAQSVIDAINAVDPNSLTDSDTSIQAIRDQYNSLTDEQKSFVTNADKLTEYEGIVQQKIAEAQQAQVARNKSNELMELYNNLQSFEGSWGDFGAHINKYQGMVESAIKASISLSSYFDNPNEVYMTLYKVEDNDSVLMNGANATNQHYMITFEGVSPTFGPARILECRVDSPDGMNLVYTEIAYYN